ncbi:MAG: DUF3078 domain-containing protein [Chitinophagales bacterium]|nr:DUF3078 domain-containing protein [Chitinophagales bacterium]MDW8418448.1 DUF3078 domain-containing protein [Chitinophagales bacterium]
MNGKPLLFVFAFLLFTVASLAQDGEGKVKTPKKQLFTGDGIFNRDSTWKFGGFAGVTLSQVTLYQWAPGGTNNFSFLLTGNAYANHKRDKILWDNLLDAKWGMVANGLIRKRALARRNFQKNIDIITFKSNFGYQVTSQLYAAAKLGFESQITRSYDYTLTDTSGGRFRRYTVSKFAAPAVLTIGPGLTWKPKDYFTLFFSPVHGKMTFVTKDRDGRDTTRFGDGTYVDNYYNDVDETRFGLLRGRSFMGELGAELDLLFQKDIIKNVNLKSHLNVFSAYLNASYDTLAPVYFADVDSMGFRGISASTKHIPVVKWENDIVLKINRFLSATLSNRMVYQYNAKLPSDVKDNTTGVKGADGISDRDKLGNPVLKYNSIQIFQQFSIGLAFKF